MLKLEGEWGVKPDQDNMNKSQYFKAMSGRRLTKIEEQLRLMKNQANKRNYSYTPEDIEKIEKVLKEMVTDTLETLKGNKQSYFTLK